MIWPSFLFWQKGCYYLPGVDYQQHNTSCRFREMVNIMIKFIIIIIIIIIIW